MTQALYTAVLVYVISLSFSQTNVADMLVSSSFNHVPVDFCIKTEAISDGRAQNIEFMYDF